MRSTRLPAVLLVLLTSASGCHQGGSRTRRSEPAPKVSHDAHELGAVMDLPATPLEVSFEEIPRGTPGPIGPTDYILLAVVRFDADVVRQLVAAAAPDASSSAVVPLPNRPWLPAAVKAKIIGVDASGVLVRGQELAPEPVLKSPFLLGSALVVEGTDYVVVLGYTT